MPRKKMISTEVLGSWRSLNEALLSATEEDCQRLMVAERTGRKRLRIALRIHSRINKVRAARERDELAKVFS